jgi:glycosyltransferase involved in cell wall biosynthesis
MITVIIPMYNSENTITRCINSVINQTYNGSIEIIIINDGSTDRSKLIVEDLISNNNFEKFNIRLINKFNGGVSTARNTGLYEVKGNYIAFLDSDDEWLPDKLNRQLEVFNLDKSISFLGGLIDKSNNLNEKLLQIPLSKLIFKNYFQPSTVIFKKEIIHKIGYFDETQKYAEEGNYFIRIAKEFKCVLLNEKLINYGQGKFGFGESGLSANLIKMQKGELRNLKYAFQNNYITFFTYLLAIIYSILKFFRRVLIVKFRKIC